ncbi:hypothetical protein ACSTJF_00015, partial [Vibrio parahaemolyticus]
NGIDVAAHIAGPWAKPEAHGHVNIAGLKAGGAAVEKLVATIAGNPGQVTLDATLDGTRLPGPKPELFAA